MRSFDPPGIACIDLQESLLRQMDIQGIAAGRPGPPHDRRGLGPLPAPAVPRRGQEAGVELAELEEELSS